MAYQRKQYKKSYPRKTYKKKTTVAKAKSLFQSYKIMDSDQILLAGEMKIDVAVDAGTCFGYSSTPLLGNTDKPGILSQCANYAKLRDFYDQVRVDGVKLKLSKFSPTFSTDLEGANVGISWDPNGLYDTATPEHPHGNGVQQATWESISKSANSTTRRMEQYSTWNMKCQFYPRTMQEKQQYLPARIVNMSSADQKADYYANTAGFVCLAVPFNPVFNIGVVKREASLFSTITFIVEYKVAVTLRGKNKK